MRRILVLVGVGIVVLGIVFYLSPNWLASIIWFLRANPSIIFALILATVALLLFANAGPTSTYTDRKSVAALAVSGLAFLTLLIGPTLTAYLVSASYAQEFATEDGGLPDTDQRLPYSIAQAQSRTSIHDLPGAEIMEDTTRYLPTVVDGGEYSTLVRGRSALGKYATVAIQSYQGTQRTVGKQCDFAGGATEILGGWFHHNLGREINRKNLFVNWDNSDAYGVCVNDTPLVVVPLKKIDGWLVPTQAPAGAAIYNGHSDELTIEQDSKNIPGGGYPLSLAERQIKGSSASEGLWRWLFRSAGVEPADAIGNNINFVTKETDGGPTLITPLRHRGSSPSIFGVASIRSDGWTSGDRNPVRIFRNDPQWLSTEAISSRIQADYQDIPNWQAITILEILPVSSTRWTAIIGNEQNVQYVVQGTGDLSQIDGASEGAATCLYTPRDLEAPVRCGTEALRDGQGVGGQYGPDRSGDVSSPASEEGGIDIDGLTREELVDLLRRVADELERAQN